jgi:hypothetical protein
MQDILVPEILPDNRSIATRALSGKDGATLWSQPCGTGPNSQQNMADWIPPTAVDLDGDGQTEFVLLDIQKVTVAGQPNLPAYCTVALEGKDGKLRWNAPSNTLTDYWHPPAGYRKSDLLRPRVLRAQKGHRIAMMLPPANAAAKVVVLEPEGAMLSTYETTPGSGMPALWPCDIDGDEVDEAAFPSGETLCVARADKMHEPIWTRRIGSAGQHRILQILASDATVPVIVVAADATDNTVQGINAADGKTVWSCPGPIPRDPRDGVYLTPYHVTLLDDGKSAPPRVYYAYGQVSRSRQAASTSRPEVPSPVVASDDRWKRDLPWVNPFLKVEDQLRFTGWSLFFATFLIVLPCGYLGHLVWSRRFTLGTLLWLPVIAGLFLTVALMRPPIQDNDFVSLNARMSMGLALAPPVIALLMLGWWGYQGRWRSVVGWLAVSIVFSIVLAVILLWTRDRAPLLPEESYDWRGWYVIWAGGAYATSWLMMVLIPFQYLALKFWRWWKKRDRTQKAQPSIA